MKPLFLLICISFSASIWSQNEITVSPIEFTLGDTTLTKKGIEEYELLYKFLNEYENFAIGLIGQLDSETDSVLSKLRATIIRNKLIFDGVFADRLRIMPSQTYPLNNRNAGVALTITSTDYFPCTGGAVINFDKKTNEIVEMRCDSLKFIANYITSKDKKFDLIGIYTNPSPEAKKKAKLRAILARRELHQLGIPRRKMAIKIAYYPTPPSEKPRDWPFYPESYSYEIGVYTLPAFH